MNEPGLLSRRPASAAGHDAPASGRWWPGRLIILSILAVSPVLAESSVADPDSVPASDRIIVKFRAVAAPLGQAAVARGARTAGGPSEAGRAPVRQSVNASLVRRFRADERSEVWQLPAGGSVSDAVARLRGRADVEYAEPDYRLAVAVAPDDPSFVDGTQWGLRNTGQSGPDGTGIDGADISAPEGWEIRTDASSVIVAVIDTGIRRTHEDLAENLWTNGGEIPGNGIDDDGNGYVDDANGLNAITYTGGDSPAGDPNDDYGHGTHVAGIIGGRGNNAKGVAGVAWRVELMACKFLDSNGYGYTSDAVECIDYARLNGAKVMNNSWGGSGFSQALLEAIQRARDAGIVFVAAAGNAYASTDRLPFYPASYPADNIVAVAATTRRDELAYFSDYGASSVALGAPGYGIYSTYHASDTAYERMDGTSMAAPFVAGAFALMRAQFPEDTYRRLINRVLNSTRPVAALAGRTVTGGVLDLHGALTAMNTAPTNDLVARAIDIPTVARGANFETAGSNDGAGLEAGEPVNDGNAGGASVWYRLTVTQAGPTTLTVTGVGPFRPILAVYLLGAGGALVRQGGVATGTNTGAVTFDPQVGRTYAIAIDGFDGMAGSFDLRGRQPPANDDFANATGIAGLHGSLAQAACGAGREAGEPQPFGSYAGGASIWFNWTAPTSAAYTFGMVADGASDMAVLSIYRGGAVDALAREPTVLENSVGGVETGRSGVLQNFQVLLMAEAGATYRIQADVASPGFGLGNFRLFWDATPANNDFVTGRVLAGPGGLVAGDTRGATAWPGYFRPPYQVYGYGSKDVWFSWTAPRSGWVEFDTLTGTDWDTTLEVFTGAAETSLALVAANDDSGGVAQSLVSFYAQAGTVYRVKLDGYTESVYSVGDTPAGPYELHWESAAAVAGDFGGDRTADLLLENRATGERQAWLMHGTTPVNTVVLGVIPTDWSIAGAGDFNGDGQTDVLWQRTTTGERGIWLMDGTTCTGWVPLGIIPTDWDMAGVGDFNGDGQDDVLWQRTTTGERGLWLMDGTTVTGWVSLGIIPTDWAIAGAGDFNADGSVDVLWQRTTTGERGIWLMSGTSVAGWASLGLVSTDWDIAGTGDFNADGQPDIIWQNTATGERRLWLMNGTAKTAEVSLGLVPTDWRMRN